MSAHIVTVEAVAIVNIAMIRFMTFVVVMALIFLFITTELDILVDARFHLDIDAVGKSGGYCAAFKLLHGFFGCEAIHKCAVAYPFDHSFQAL